MEGRDGVVMQSHYGKVKQSYSMPIIHTTPTRLHLVML